LAGLVDVLGLDDIMKGNPRFVGEDNAFNWTVVDRALADSATCQKDVGWYAAAFFKTPVQLRYTEDAARSTGFGLHNDSFVRETIDGASNGGEIEVFTFGQWCFVRAADWSGTFLL
jgi:hypothetical protein